MRGSGEQWRVFDRGGVVQHRKSLRLGIACAQPPVSWILTHALSAHGSHDGWTRMSFPMHSGHQSGVTITGGKTRPLSLSSALRIPFLEVTHHSLEGCVRNSVFSTGFCTKGPLLHTTPDRKQCEVGHQDNSRRPTPPVAQPTCAWTPQL